MKLVVPSRGSIIQVNSLPILLDVFSSAIKPASGVMFNKYFGNPFPPFGGNIEEYKSLFNEKFEIKTLENCYNSIKPRKNNRN